MSATPNHTIRFHVQVDDHWDEVIDAAQLAGVRASVEQAELIAREARDSIELSASIQVGFGTINRGGVIEVAQQDSGVDFALAQLVDFLPGAHAYYRHRSSLPGHPPKTRGVPGKNLPEAIIVTHNADGSASVGCDPSIIGPIGDVMEFGGEFRGHNYPPHPFLRPAMAHQLENFSQQFVVDLFSH